MTKENLTEVPAVETKVEKKVEKKSDYTLEINADFYGNVDPFYLSEQDPDYEYRFLRADDKNLSIKTGNLLYQKGGWQICGRDHLKRLKIKDRFISPDGMYRIGDTVLAFMPKELFAKKNEEKKRKADEPVKAIDRLLKKGDPTAGGKEIHDSMRGVQTQKELGM